MKFKSFLKFNGRQYFCIFCNEVLDKLSSGSVLVCNNYDCKRSFTIWPDCNNLYFSIKNIKYYLSCSIYYNAQKIHCIYDNEAYIMPLFLFSDEEDFLIKFKTAILFQ